MTYMINNEHNQYDHCNFKRNIRCTKFLHVDYTIIFCATVIYLKSFKMLMLPKISWGKLSVSREKDWNVHICVCMCVWSPYTEGFAKASGALHILCTYIHTFQSFFLQIQWGAWQGPIQMVLIKPLGAVHMHKGLYEAHRGFIHTYINTYAYFINLSYRFGMPHKDTTEWALHR